MGAFTPGGIDLHSGQGSVAKGHREIHARLRDEGLNLELLWSIEMLK